MAKKAVSILLILLLCWPALAEGGADREAYEAVMAAEHITLEEALAQLEGVESEDGEVLALRQDLTDLAACQGRFIQQNKYEDTEKVYTADVEFYLEEGTVYAHVDYTNYAGTLDDGSVERAEEGGEYLFVSRPEGEFYGNTQQFEIEFGAQTMHITWADGACDYLLDRGTGAVSDTDEIPFVETSRYQTLTDTLDNLFDGQAHSYTYDEDARTMTAYVVIAEGMRDTLEASSLAVSAIYENWEELMDMSITITENMAEALTLATRDGILDVGEATFSIVFVDELPEDGDCDEDEVLAIITNGEVVYDFVSGLLDDATAGSLGLSGAGDTQSDKAAYPGVSSSAGSATLGERNALESAQSYLRSIPFSRSGLIDQLEYEGFSRSEAEYAVANCGADWYEQAERSAQSYLRNLAFSRSGLIDQLEYEGFSASEAEHAVANCGADWYEQAAKSARSYLNVMSFSRSELIDQLEYEGFTYDQAVYGVEQNGY